MVFCLCSRAVGCVAVAVLLTSATAHAERSTLSPETGYNYGEAEDARWAASAGAMRAMGSGATAVFHNPAGMTASEVYHMAGTAQVWPEAKRQSYGVAVMDSTSSWRLAAGVGYVWTSQDPDGLKRRSSDLRVALGFPLSDAVAFGTTLRYLRLEQNGLGPLGRSYTSGGLAGDPIINGFSFDAGVRIRPSEHFAIGALGTNLSNPGNGFQPTTFGGGLVFGTKDFAVEGDGLADFTTWGRTTARLMTALQLLVADRFPLRLGYRYDDGAKSHAVSGGAGYVDPQFSIEVGARRIVKGDPATALVFTIEYYGLQDAFAGR